MANFEELYNKLGSFSKGANTSCKEFTAILEKLGFQIVDCGSAGHKIAKHPAVDWREYPDFDCGHSKGANVKPIYIKKLYKFVKQNEEGIKEHLK